MIAITVIVLLLIGGGIFMMNRSRSASITPQSAQSQQSAQNTTAAEQTTSLKDLMTASGNQRCTFTDTETGNNGTMYIGGGKMRGDFTSQIDNRTTTSHMISEGENAFVWMDDQKSGYKVSMQSMEGLNAKTNTNAPQAVDVNKQMNYRCSPWSADTSMFVPPTNIQFQDMSAMMGNTGTMMQGEGSKTNGGAIPDQMEACAACEQAPPEVQAQCKAALKCN